nr:translation initiation factor 1 [Citrus australasica]UCS07818.1 translation initiation factor 1 [Citrus australasica]
MFQEGCDPFFYIYIYYYTYTPGD